MGGQHSHTHLKSSRIEEKLDGDKGSDKLQSGFGNSIIRNLSPSPRKGKKHQKDRKLSRTPDQEVTSEELSGDHSEAREITATEIRQSQAKAMEEARPTLDPQRVALVIHTWNIVREDVAKVGFEMFERLFETYPDTRGAFGPFKKISPDDARFAEELRQHGLRVLNTVQEVLDRIEDEEAMVEHLHDLGLRHITFNAKPEYIDLIGPQFLWAIEPILKSDWTIEVEEAWSELFKFIGHVMRESMTL